MVSVKIANQGALYLGHYLMQWHTDGSVGYLDHRDRISWSIKTAKRYCKEVNQSLIAGRYAGCIYASVVEAC